MQTKHFSYLLFFASAFSVVEAMKRGEPDTSTEEKSGIDNNQLAQLAREREARARKNQRHLAELQALAQNPNNAPTNSAQSAAVSEMSEEDQIKMDACKAVIVTTDAIINEITNSILDEIVVLEIACSQLASLNENIANFNAIGGDEGLNQHQAFIQTKESFAQSIIQILELMGSQKRYLKEVMLPGNNAFYDFTSNLEELGNNLVLLGHEKIVVFTEYEVQQIITEWEDEQEIAKASAEADILAAQALDEEINPDPTDNDALIADELSQREAQERSERDEQIARNFAAVDQQVLQAGDRQFAQQLARNAGQNNNQNI